MKCRKNIRLAALSLVTFLTLTSCAAASSFGESTDSTQQPTQQKDWNYAFHYTSDYWNRYDFSNSFIPTQNDFEILVASYIPQIETLLGVQDWYTAIDAAADTIFVNLEIGGTAHAMVCSPSKGADKTIEFSILLSRNQINTSTDFTLPHELTHSVLGRSCFSNSLEEGLCDYVSARIGVRFHRFFEEYEIEALDFYTYDAKLALENFDDAEKSEAMLDTIGRAGGYPYSLQTQEGHLWYECSQSFVEYLVKNYGMEKTVQLIREGKDETDYQKYLGVRYEELKEGWTAFLKNYESSYTMEEYRQMTKTFFQTNGG